MKRIFFALLVASLAAPLLARTSVKSDWESNPQSCFMTLSERAEWNAINTDVDAQAFIEKFLARRGPEFAAEVQDRAARADQYFTIGKVRGSQSLRGRVIILLGPPSGLEILNVNDTHVHRESEETAGAYNNGPGGASEGGGPSVSNAMSATRSVRNYYFSYANPKLSVAVPADPNTGRDLPLTPSDKKALDAAFEQAAQASIKK